MNVLKDIDLLSPASVMGSSLSARAIVETQAPHLNPGRVAIVTGPNTGIGKQTCLALALCFHTVILAGRSMKRLTDAADDIRAELGKTGIAPDLRCLVLDLSSLHSVREFVASFKALNLQGLHLLVNNAGIMGPPHAVTAEGLESQFGTNHMGHFYLTELLLANLRASAPSRIVNVSSEAHKMAGTLPAAPELTLADLSPDAANYSRFGSYGISKLSNIWHAKELSQRLAGTGVTAFSLHPGVVDTELGRNFCGANCFYTVWYASARVLGGLCLVVPDLLGGVLFFYRVISAGAACVTSTKGRPPRCTAPWRQTRLLPGATANTLTSVPSAKRPPWHAAMNTPRSCISCRSSFYSPRGLPSTHEQTLNTNRKCCPVVARP